MPNKLTISVPILLDLLTRNGFEAQPSSGETLVLRHAVTRQIFTLCAPPDARIGRGLLTRILIDLNLISSDLSCKPQSETKPLQHFLGFGTLDEQLNQYEAQIIQAALDQHGNVSRAAEALGVSRPRLYDRMRVHGCTNPRALSRPAVLFLSPKPQAHQQEGVSPAHAETVAAEQRTPVGVA